MADPNVEEVAVRFKGDRVLLRWKYENQPQNHYKWFDM